MTTIKRVILSAGVAGMLNLGIAAHAVPINLNDFSATEAVSISPDGTFAQLTEDAAFGGPSLLENDPGLGDLALFSTGPGASIVFKYTFNPEPNNNDRLRASVIDPITHAVFNGLDEFFPLSVTPLTAFTFDLGVLPRQSVGLRFELVDFNIPDQIQEFLSVATIQDVEFTTPSIVSEPTSIWLLAAALLSPIRRKLWKKCAARGHLRNTDTPFRQVAM